MKRILFYVHYNKYQGLSNHVLYQLTSISPLFEEIHIISNSSLTLTDKQRLKKCGKFVSVTERENKGFDFAAWSEAMQKQGYPKLASYDSLVLMNDTCFGPFKNLEPYFQQFESNPSIDFWGMTDFRRTWRFNHHLQSYFLSFSKKVVQSKVFQSFWNTVSDSTGDVQKVIKQYEARLTGVLSRAGFTYQALVPTSQLDNSDIVNPDFTFYKPQLLLEQGLPFVKVKAIDANQVWARQCLDYLQQQSDYPVNLIKEHLFQVLAPDSVCLLEDKISHAGEDFDSKVIHIHVKSSEYLKKLFSLMPVDYQKADFVFTGVDESLLVATAHFYQKQGIKVKIQTVEDNRSLAAFLAISESVKSYDLIGHLSSELPFMKDGEELLSNFFSSFPKRVAMDRFAEVGLWINDLPDKGLYDESNGILSSQELLDLEKEWRTLGLKKTVSFIEWGRLIPVAGESFWCSSSLYGHLEDLYGHKEAKESLLRNWFYFLVYIAWAQNIDFHFLKSRTLSINLFKKIASERIRHQVLSPHPRTFLQKIIFRIHLLFGKKT